MSLALYRRYRPETFAEVIGQEHVTGPLQQALRNNRVNHAYLFSGPRGCGKTTSARILARCLNCEQGPTPTPCGECRSCLDLARGGPGSIDVIEIDAASHGGVDDTRDLREKAFFAPASSRYKIYIIDEAHMVSTAGFNALLKVVEEPPEHLKFIFATTEPEKVIGTIRSRTHHYPFRLVPPGVLRDYLAEVCGHESIQVEDSVYPLVVRAGAGSVRDSMSVMDQLLAGADAGGVTYAMATALLGYTDATLLDEIVDAFATQDGSTVFGIVDRVIEGGHDPRRFVADLLERLRDLVILAAVPDAGEKGLIDAPADRVALMDQQAQRFGAAELSRAADIVNTGLTEMRGATSPRLQLELICARVMLPAAFSDETSLQARLEKLERRGLVGGAVAGGAPVFAAAPAPESTPIAAAPAMPAPTPVQPAAAVPPAAPVASAAATGRAPGAWPVAPSFGQQPPARPEPQAAPAPTPTPAQPQAPAPAAAESGGAGAGGVSAAQVRQVWPQILDAVKGRRRVTWMLLQQAQVAGFDNGALQLGFEHAGTRDGFVNGGHDEILRQALQEALGVSWKVECLIGPAGGAAGRSSAPARPQAAPAQTPAPFQAPAAPPAFQPTPAPAPAPPRRRRPRSRRPRRPLPPPTRARTTTTCRRPPSIRRRTSPSRTSPPSRATI
ncbi:DNA polymerase III subunit gamma and tau [Streptacidiphilus rugosus]|uniref:DNA polymerase III subunit gamma and tau n=1 Tax=Streptacidiphilus rugosus TaxID=405783 RepID=UPI000AD0E9F9